MILSPCEALEKFLLGEKVEYYDDGWWPLDKDQPIRLLWQYQIRVKTEE